uniref:Uncharacterized protein n=1 Tax=Arundo donax TaxID=35708 RepID=A0A0A8YV22_ARUDO
MEAVEQRSAAMATAAARRAAWRLLIFFLLSLWSMVVVAICSWLFLGLAWLAGLFGMF